MTGGLIDGECRWRIGCTERGRPAHVLLTIEDYWRLAGEGPTIVDHLAMADAGTVDFDPPRLNDGLFRPADLA